MTNSYKLPSVMLLALSIVAGMSVFHTWASGFQLREQSPSAQGNAFAGVSAGGSDISSMFFNPATMTLFSGKQISAGFSLVQPFSESKNGVATRFLSSFGSIAGPAYHPDAAKNVPLPSAYALWSISNDLKLGLSLNVPFGMGTEYQSDYIGRYHALKSSLNVVDAAANMAYRVNSYLSVGASVVGRRSSAELTNAVDFATIILASSQIPSSAKAGITPGSLDGQANLEGNKTDFGYKLGFTVQPTKNIRLGLARHSAMNTTLDGDITYTGVPAILSTAFKNGGGTAELRLPGMTSFGLHVDLTPKVSAQMEVARTGWSTFKELRVQFDTGQADSVTEENWKDTWFWSAGLTWKPAGAWTLRTGLAKDQSAVTAEYRTPRIPDADRTWISAGASYAFSKSWSVDFAYTHIFVQDSVMDLKAIPAGTTAATSNNTFRGNIGGDVFNKIDILTLQARFSF